MLKILSVVQKFVYGLSFAVFSNEKSLQSHTPIELNVQCEVCTSFRFDTISMGHRRLVFEHHTILPGKQRSQVAMGRIRDPSSGCVVFHFLPAPPHIRSRGRRTGADFRIWRVVRKRDQQQQQLDKR